VYRIALLGVGGLLFGSFLTVVVSRLPERRSIVVSRSACPRCGSLVRATDNIPLLSYVMLGGRCRGCDQPISPLYPAIEAVTAGLFMAVGWALRSVWEDVVIAPFLGILLSAAIIDIRHRIIPNRLVYAAMAVFVALLMVAWIVGAEPNLIGAVAGLLGYGGGMLVVALLVPGGMGMGDVKLAALIGLVLGAVGLGYVTVAAMGATLSGGIGAVAALLAGRDRRSTIPFGPHMAAGAMIAVLFGGPLAAWYGGILR
jgi:leader peptidase (prepilin peptidase)/N-methyltransferase